MKPKVIIIYHSADYDGIASGRIAKYFVETAGMEAVMFGWDYGNDTSALLHYIEATTYPVVMLDIYIHEVFLLFNRLVERVPSVFGRLTWIDHHATSIEQAKFVTDKYQIDGLRIDGVAACRLAFNYFAHKPDDVCRRLEDYKERRVVEPHLIRLLGEYDVWCKNDPDALFLQYGLRAKNITVNSDSFWTTYLGEFMQWFALGSLTKEMGPTSEFGDSKFFNEPLRRLIDNGQVAYGWAKNYFEGVMRATCRKVVYEGLTFLLANVSVGNSLSFDAFDNEDSGHDALMMFRFAASGKVLLSLYHSKSRTDIDLSPIAKKHGGGGHRGACGFQLTANEFYSLIWGKSEDLH